MYCPSCHDEFREGFTWCPDCETPLVAGLPEEVEGPEEREEAPETGEELQAETAAVGPESDSAKVLRAFELLLVLFIAFSYSLLVSLFDWWHGVRSSDSHSLIADLSRIVDATGALSLLCYVLSRQGRNLHSLGLRAEKTDVLHALLLTIVSFAVRQILRLAIFDSPLSTGVAAHPWMALTGIPSLGPITIVALLFSAAKEEIIVRAFMVTEVVELTGQIPLAILSSVCLQALYHLYQGSPNALLHSGSFLLYSIYYAKYRRITPVILAHALGNTLVSGYLTAPGN
jgi:membrane protease YdiL (CAAX protease family)